MEQAEKITGHKWDFKFCEKGKPCNPALWTKYNFNPELSEDVIITQDNIAAAEEKLGEDFNPETVAYENEKYSYAGGEPATW